MSESTSPIRRLTVLLALLAVVAAACGNSSDETGGPAPGGGGDDTKVSISGVPGVTDDEIRFAAFGTQANNPLGTCVLECYTHGIEAYFAYRNSEGGVHGRDMVLSTVLDDELSQNQVRALEIVTANDTFAAFSATQVASGWGDITKAGMPLYVWNIHPVETTDPGVFGNVGVICVECTKRIDAQLLREAGASKAAVMGYGISENSKLSAASSRSAVELYGDVTGAEVVYFNDNLAFGLPNGIGPEVTAMKRAGVDFIFASVDLNAMKTLAQELERQGMGDVPMVHPNTYDHAFVQEAGSLFEGDYLYTTFRPFEAQAEGTGLEQFMTWMEEIGEEVTELAVYGWINADTAYRGLVEAGPDFDREKVLEATRALTAYTADGLLPPLDFSRQQQPPTQEDPATHGWVEECFVLMKIVDGDFQILGDEAAPWSCWSNADREWAEPESKNFT